MKRALAFILWASIRACPLLGQAVAYVDSATNVTLQHWAADSIEHAACLYGETVPDTVWFWRVVVPTQTPIGDHGLAVAPCGPTALAHWHSHTVPRDSVAQNYLYYSLTDQNTFMRHEDAPFAIVQVPGAACLWTRQQVHVAWMENRTPAYPDPKQCWVAL